MFHPDDAEAIIRMVGLKDLSEPKLERVYEDALKMFQRGGRTGSFCEEPGGLAALAVLLAMNGFKPPKEAAPSGITDWRTISPGTRVLVCTREQERYGGEFLRIVGVGRLEVRVDGMKSLREFRTIEVQPDRGQIFKGPPNLPGYVSTPYDPAVAGKTAPEYGCGEKVQVTFDGVESTATFMRYGPRAQWATVNYNGEPRPIDLKRVAKLAEQPAELETADF